jgi:hypothetical protein
VALNLPIMKWTVSKRSHPWDPRKWVVLRPHADYGAYVVAVFRDHDTAFAFAEARALAAVEKLLSTTP